MMASNRMVMLLVFVLAVFAPPEGNTQEHSLEEVLTGMDDVSREFRNMVADIEREQVVVFINESSFESGRMYFVRRGEGSRIRVSILEPAPKDLLIDDGQVGVYNPLTNVLQETSLGEHEDKVEFMVLGFGTSRDDLLNYYEVAFVGEETLDGRMVAVLDLVPRDPAVARQFTVIRLWVDPEVWMPVQTRATQPSGDYLIIQFSNVRTNTDLPDSAFDLNLPDDVEIVRP